MYINFNFPFLIMYRKNMYTMATLIEGSIQHEFIWRCIVFAFFLFPNSVLMRRKIKKKRVFRHFKQMMR